MESLIGVLRGLVDWADHHSGFIALLVGLIPLLIFFWPKKRREQSEKRFNEIIDRRFAELTKQATQPIKPEEAKNLREVLQGLLAATDKERAPIAKLLADNKLPQAIDALRALAKSQDALTEKTSAEAAKTHIELAALLTYSAPQESLSHLQKAVALEPENLQARNELGILLDRFGRYKEAIKEYEAIHKLATERGDKEWQGNALGNLGLAYDSLGQYQKAIEHHEKALTIAREIGDRRGEGNDLGNLGISYRSLGQYQKAVEYLGIALAIAREIGHRRGEGNRLGNLGNAYGSLGQYQKASEHHEKALTIAREIGDRQGEGNHLFNLGLVKAKLGKKEEAKRLTKAALKIYEEIGSPHAQTARANLAELEAE